MGHLYLKLIELCNFLVSKKGKELPTGFPGSSSQYLMVPYHA